MDFIWILFAFVCGLAVRQINLPPLVGYLAAGFLLNMFGYGGAHGLQVLADIGITLMLFTIGLKLNVKDLLHTEVWAGALTHMGLWVAGVTGILVLVSVVWPLLGGVDFKTAALIAFALSFSSTVCVIKLLEDSGELKTRHGRFSIAILVMQDIVAVAYLVIATGKVPSWWAAALPLLILVRPLLSRLLKEAGHGELLPLTGFFLALGGYELFSLVNVKGDLGALVVGMLLSTHPKAVELTKSLLSFKDLFLIGFFLLIGLSAVPSVEIALVALLVCLLLPIKSMLFFFLFTKLRLRVRSAFVSSLALGNYSEFGLIVLALSVESGWVGNEWLTMAALAVAFSFVLTNVFYKGVHSYYARYRDGLRRFEHPSPLMQDQPIRLQGAEVLVIGLGRVGRGAFMSLQEFIGNRVAGMDADRRVIRSLEQQSLRVYIGDAEDADLWENIDLGSTRLVLLAMPSIEDNVNITEQLRRADYRGKIAAIARYEDEHAPLLEGGIDKVFNFFTEAGTGFAEESLKMMRYD